MDMNASSVDSVTEGFSFLHSNSSHASGGPRVAEYSDDAKNEAATLLVGKLFSERLSNKTGTWEAIQKSWSFVPNLVISYGPDDSFIFSFPNTTIRDRVLRQAPWNIRGAMLVLREWDVDSTLQELSFDMAPLWVQIHGLPLGHMTKTSTLELGLKARKVLEVDFDETKKVWGIAYLRALVMVDLSQPLYLGFPLERPNKSPIWIQYRYERISEWCLHCG